jgi:hypothetical protein
MDKLKVLAPLCPMFFLSNFSNDFCNMKQILGGGSISKQVIMRGKEIPYSMLTTAIRID